MAVSQVESNRRVRVLSEGIRQAGLRLTHQRLEIVREIAGTDVHPDVEEVYEGVRERVPTISLDTVYRTLSALTDRGLIERVTATPGPARYDGNPFHHHHFVCTRCGLVRDIDDGDLDAISGTPQTKLLGRVESVQVLYRGVCAACKTSDTPGDRRLARGKGRHSG